MKIEFQELQKAALRAESAGLLAAEPSWSEASFSFQSVANLDPNLALAGLRIEIEKRLSLLAQAYGLDGGRSMGIGQLFRALTKAEVLTSEERSVLADMTNMLNAAVHGATVDSRTADWAPPPWPAGQVRIRPFVHGKSPPSAGVTPPAIR